MMSKNSQKNKNALRHGLYTSEIVLPWESEADFIALLEEFMKEYRPQGPTEHELVIDIARLRWLKRRIMRSADLKFRADVMATRIGKAGRGSLDEILNHVEKEAMGDDAIRKALKVMSSLMKEELSRVMKWAPNNDMTEQEKADATQKSADGLDNLRKTFEVLLPLAKSIEGLRDERSVVEIAYAADTLERIIRLEGMLDARFEKALGRLLALQDMKRTINVRKITQLPRDVE